MGNKNSTNDGQQINGQNPNELKATSVSHILDYIATNYILTMDFKSLKNLYKKEYCDELVILTSDIIQRYFTDLEITYLSQRIKQGQEINETSKDKIIFFNNDELNNLDIQNSVKKKRICLSIAKFYIKIAHIFSAILTTINPIYIYKDAEGNTERVSLYEKGKIPKNVPRTIYKMNICSERVKALENKQSLDPDANGEITVSPKICNMNIGDDGNEKYLADEPGIPELEDLYKDDNYDFNTGQFNGMTEETKKIFNHDLKIFYNIFTGKDDMPPNIQKFSDIKLRDFHSMEKCAGENAPFKRKVKGPLTNKLFNDYAEHLKTMIRTANKNQEALLNIINQIFVYTIDPQTGKKKIRINPSLTEERLQEIVIETRSIIIKLYLTCEMDYVNGLKIYEAIVEKKIFETSQKQIEHLEKLSEQIITKVELPELAETQVLKQKAEEKIAEDKDKIEKQLDDIKKDEQMIEQDPTAILKDDKPLAPAPAPPPETTTQVKQV